MIQRFTEHERPECKSFFFGKYRGTVVNNVDPLMKGRLLVQVADVLGPTLSSWALPCLPVGGIQHGMFSVPVMGAGVWVEFEQGDPDYPIWTGCFAGNTGELPALAKMVPPGIPGITLQTPSQNGIVLNDAPGVGGIMLKTTSGAAIIMNETGILITTGPGGATIMMTGKTITVNEGALVVT